MAAWEDTNEVMRIVRVCVLLVQVAAGAGTPSQPDFSGDWTLVATVPAYSGVPKALVVRQAVMRPNPHGEPIAPSFSSIKIERQSETATTVETHAIGVAGGTVGGIVNTAARPMPPRVLSRHAVKWEGNRLVFELETSTGNTPGAGEWSERRETWALQPNGELAVDIATSSSGHRARTVSATYRRR